MDNIFKTINKEDSKNIIYSEVYNIDGVGTKILESHQIGHLKEEIEKHLPIKHNFFVNPNVYEEIKSEIINNKKLNNNEIMGLHYFFLEYLRSLECVVVNLDNFDNNDEELKDKYVKQVIGNGAARTSKNFCIAIEDIHKGLTLEIRLNKCSKDSNSSDPSDFYIRRSDKDEIIGRNWERIEDSLGIRFNKSKDKSFFIEMDNENCSYFKNDILQVLGSNAKNYLSTNHVEGQFYKLTLTLYDLEGNDIEMAQMYLTL